MSGLDPLGERANRQDYGAENRMHAFLLGLLSIKVSCRIEGVVERDSIDHSQYTSCCDTQAAMPSEIFCYPASHLNLAHQFLPAWLMVVSRAGLILYHSLRKPIYLRYINPHQTRSYNGPTHHQKHHPLPNPNIKETDKPSPHQNQPKPR